MEIKVIRGDSGIWISPAPPYLLQYLQYSKRSFGTHFYKKINKYEKVLLYSQDGVGGIFTLAGFFTKISELIKKNRDIIKVEDRRSKLPEIDWNAVKAVGLRDYQVDPMIDFLQAGYLESGAVNASGGFGKGHLIAATYAAWNGLNTILAVPYKEVTNQLYKLFKEKFPDKHIGRIGSGYSDISSDITITTFKSLELCSLEKCKLLLLDEYQGGTGDKIQKVLTQINSIRVFGYSATDYGLFSKADKLLKGLVGPNLINIEYQESLDLGAVVPGIVYMLRMPSTFGIDGSIDVKIRNGIMKNKIRNSLIGEICKTIPKGNQTLIFVDHIKNHLLNLLPYLPEGTQYIHRESGGDDIGEFALSSKEQDQIISDFVDNKTQFLLSTNALKAGFNSQNCRCVIMAAGGVSRINTLQKAFRGSRTLPIERQVELGVEPKTHFILIDFIDRQDDVLLRMSEQRIEHYKSQQWEIKIIDSPSQIVWK